MKDLFSGARHFLAGLKIIRQPGLKRYVMVPLAVNVAVFGGLIYQAVHWYQLLLDKLLGYLPGWLAWLQYLLLPLIEALVGDDLLDDLFDAGGATQLPYGFDRRPVQIAVARNSNCVARPHGSAVCQLTPHLCDQVLDEGGC